MSQLRAALACRRRWRALKLEHTVAAPGVQNSEVRFANVHTWHLQTSLKFWATFNTALQDMPSPFIALYNGYSAALRYTAPQTGQKIVEAYLYSKELVKNIIAANLGIPGLGSHV